MRLLIALAGLSLLAACGGGSDTGLTADEDQALNEAAAMLDAAPEGTVPTDETGLDGNALEPADEATPANTTE